MCYWCMARAWAAIPLKKIDSSSPSYICACECVYVCSLGEYIHICVCLYMYICIYVCVCALFLWEFRNVGIHVLRSMGGGQRTASEVGPCPPPSLRWSLVPRRYRWETRCPFSTSLVSALHLCRGALGFRMFTVTSSFTWNLGIWTKVFTPAQEMLCPLSLTSPVHF